MSDGYLVYKHISPSKKMYIGITYTSEQEAIDRAAILRNEFNS